VVPRQAVDVGFHDPQFATAAEKCAFISGAEVAVEFMRRDVDLEMLGGGGDLIDCQTPFQGWSMMATSIACSVK